MLFSNFYAHYILTAIFEFTQPVLVTGVSLNESSVTLLVGNTEQLTATVAPANATDKNVTWTSSNTNVATVSANGLITTISAGTATITATTQVGGYTASCIVTVTPPIDISSDFTDPNFRTAVYALIGKTTPAPIYDFDVKTITSLDVSGKNIQSLAGLEYFLGLINLSCTSNLLTNLDVSKNTALTDLECYNNQIGVLDVSKNKMLRTFYCDNNQLTNLDVGNNTALIDLSCSNNQLTGLDVSKNMALIDLVCDNNQLTGLDVSKNTAMLITLSCRNNQLTNLDVSKNTRLQYLYCDNNPLAGLDVSNNKVLIYLLCNNDQLTSFDISNNPILTMLQCYNNQITNLDVSKNTVLTYLDCSYNQLTNLDVSNNTALTYLYCYNNALPLINLYALAQRTNITTKSIGQQTLPDSTVFVNTPIAIDTVFYGVNTVCNYPLSNSEVTFPALGSYTVTIRNPGILDGVVQQTFKVVQQGTGINDISHLETLKARIQNGVLHVSGLTAGKLWSVYSVSGVLVYQNIADSDIADIALFAHGIYIVQSNGGMIKAVY